MLDTETKRKIDSARDILVGKVPDPKAQVEQITTALIYKFMDDMDREAEELGGKAKFITGELEAYQWANLMSKELSGEARLNLYMSALLVFSKAQNIPDIFRTIFKDAFLPYRDPETLNLFLKQIDYFDYDHSENLGNAFEYLLSVLGSQGDAGQFRTPRHIIDFIVEIIEPKKTDTILDPSCGTAGFLISAYKHILANETLTPEDKKRLMENFTGYDISPDMVRLSLVNLYLHSFPSPKVYEYDTLTSEDRWDESYNIILANPPFMTPKGGIRPHNRFSVQAKRSEVLFVDYIAEHLNLNGKAGIIVPEGIIFQSANAYKALRKMLVDNGFLWAVVSLPAGVFQPYSGVKTSILLLDRAIAKQHDSILFIKINQDGFDLGAQRRENTNSELPIALELLKTYRTGGVIDNALATVVLKTKVAETGDYNLTGERYRETVRHDGVYPMVKLKEICEINPEQKEPISFFGNTDFIYIDISSVENGTGCVSFDNVIKTIEAPSRARRIVKNDDVLLSTVRPNLKAFCILKNLPEKVLASTGFAVLRAKNNLNPYFLYVMIFQDFVLGQMIGSMDKGSYPSINQNDVENLVFPLPPIEIQNAIVAEIEQWQKVIDGAKQVIANYRPTITINPDWEIVKLDDVINFISGLSISIPELQSEDGMPIISINNVTEDGQLTLKGLRKITPPSKKLNILQKGDLLFNWRNGSKHLIGKTALFELDGDFLFGSFLLGIRTNKDKLNSKYLWHILNNYRVDGRYMQLMRQNVNGLFNREELKVTEIYLPPLETQNTLVEQIEKERAAVDACKTLVALFEAKIKTKIAEVWGESQT
jgi:type I restriction enzyme M protein